MFHHICFRAEEYLNPVEHCAALLLSAVNYFRRKSILDVWLGSEYVSCQGPKYAFAPAQSSFQKLSKKTLTF